MLHSSTNYHISEFLTIAPCIKKVSLCVYVISHMLTCRVVYCCLTTHGNICKHEHMSFSRVELHFNQVKKIILTIMIVLLKTDFILSSVLLQSLCLNKDTVYIDYSSFDSIVTIIIRQTHFLLMFILQQLHNCNNYQYRHLPMLSLQLGFANLNL